MRDISPPRWASSGVDYTFVILLARSDVRVEPLFALFDPFLFVLLLPKISLAKASFFFLCRSGNWSVGGVCRVSGLQESTSLDYRIEIDRCFGTRHC